MRDHLLDLVEHTFALEGIDLVKIIGDENKTIIKTMDDNQTVVVDAEFANPVPEFVGTFGMPSLGKLKILLGLEEYRENAKLTITRKPDGTPTGVDFDNASGDFHNNYRFMASQLVEAKLKEAIFNGVNWHVEFEPTVVGIQRLKWQAQANAEQANFQARTDKGDLKFFFGDHSNHAGNFVFHSGVKGTLKRAWSYPIKTVISILDLVGDKKFRVSDDGAMQITVDSGLGVYNYIVPAQSK